MEFKNSILFLGTGTSVGIPMIGCPCEVCQSSDRKDKRLRTSALVVYEKYTFLLDIGPDFRWQMLSNNISKLDAILLTHPHRDHIGGFDDIRALNFLYDVKISLYSNRYTWESLKKQFYYAFQNSDYTSLPTVHFQEIENETFQHESVEIIPIQLMHGKMPCVGYRFGKLAYMTDVNEINESEYSKLFNLDILVIDALRKYHHPSHFSLEESLEIIKILKPQKAFLIHLSHHMGKHNIVQSELPEGVFIAYDGLKIEF